MSIDATVFRKGMRHLAASVTLITTRHRELRGGLTATAVCSVSADPPQLLVCVNKTASAHDPIGEAGFFCVNILSPEQEGLSRRFAGAEPNRFLGVSYHENERGIPVIDGTVAHIECEKHTAVPGGDHTVFIGLVVGGDATDRRPLLYYRGGYAGLSR